LFIDTDPHLPFHISRDSLFEIAVMAFGHSRLKVVNHRGGCVQALPA
jgi:hypothetical protein